MIKTDIEFSHLNNFHVSGINQKLIIHQVSKKLLDDSLQMLQHNNYPLFLEGFQPPPPPQTRPQPSRPSKFNVKYENKFNLYVPCMFEYVCVYA